MLQRILSSVRANYGLTVFFLYLGAFAIAFVGTVTLPLVAIVMVIGAVLMLVPLVLLGDIIGICSRAATRPYLRRGVCPRCRAQQGPAWEAPVYRCAFCQAAYQADGDPYEGDELVVHEPGAPVAPAAPPNT